MDMAKRVEKLEANSWNLWMFLGIPNAFQLQKVFGDGIL